MAKKNRSVTSTSKAAPTFAGIQSAAAGNDFNPDYTQTKMDLKRIGTLAGGFFVVLVILAFVLPMLGF
jgi:hypothetical protein